MSGNDCRNRVCFSCCWKANSGLADVTLSGSMFHNCAAATLQAVKLSNLRLVFHEYTREIALIISLFSAANAANIVQWPGSAGGAYSTLPGSVAGLRGPTQGRGGQNRGGEEKFRLLLIFLLAILLTTLKWLKYGMACVKKEKNMQCQFNLHQFVLRQQKITAVTDTTNDTTSSEASFDRQSQRCLSGVFRASGTAASGPEHTPSDTRYIGKCCTTRDT